MSSTLRIPINSFIRHSFHSTNLVYVCLELICDSFLHGQPAGQVWVRWCRPILLSFHLPLLTKGSMLKSSCNHVQSSRSIYKMESPHPRLPSQFHHPQEPRTLAVCLDDHAWPAHVNGSHQGKTSSLVSLSIQCFGVRNKQVDKDEHCWQET